MIVAFWRNLGDLGVSTVPGFSGPAARRLLSGPVWRYLLHRSVRLARDPKRPALDGLRPYLDGIILRVAFLDAVIADAGVRQVVILGAGLDTRAWRRPALRSARVFEVDHPAMRAYKRERIALRGPALCQLEFVPVDFNPSEPTVWVIRRGVWRG